MGAAQGKKVDPAPLRLRRSRRSRPRARSSQREAVWLAPLRTASSGEDLPDIADPAQEAPGGTRRESNSGVEKGRWRPRPNPRAACLHQWFVSQAKKLCPARERFNIWAGAWSRLHGPIRRAIRATGTRRRLNSRCAPPSATAVPNSAAKAWRSRAGLPGAPFVPRPCRRQESRRQWRMRRASRVTARRSA